MKLTIQASVGEVLDKISILKIKLEKIKDPIQNRNVKFEYDTLIRSISSSFESQKIHCDIFNTTLFQDLIKVNTTLWKLEDDIRKKEQIKQFDSEFIELARQIYIQNDCRYRIKQKLNQNYKSELNEEKSY